jgi:thiamine pyrophosphokinase
MKNVFSPFEFQPEAIVIDNGEYPATEHPLKWLSSAPYIACCDGAADTFLSHNGKPDVIIGDGDSISKVNAEKYASILHRIGEQETNDQTKAVTFLMSQGLRNIVIVAGTGKREDHTLGNISLLVDYCRQECFVMMATDYGVFVPCHDDVCIKSFKGQQISVFNFGAVHFKSKNLVFPLPELSTWWQGTLNESLGDTVTVSAEGYYLLFMEYGK